MASISDPEVRAFLSHGTRTGKLGFTARDGRPLVAPIWFLVSGEGDDTEILFNTGADTAKGKAIARDPRLVLCVDLEEPPYAFVMVQGSVELSTDLDQMLPVSTAIARRYVEESEAEAFGRRNAVEGELLVRLRPDKVVAVADLTG